MRDAAAPWACTGRCWRWCRCCTRTRNTPSLSTVGAVSASMLRHQAGLAAEPDPVQAATGRPALGIPGRGPPAQRLSFTVTARCQPWAKQTVTACWAPCRPTCSASQHCLPISPAWQWSAVVSRPRCWSLARRWATHRHGCRGKRGMGSSASCSVNVQQAAETAGSAWLSTSTWHGVLCSVAGLVKASVERLRSEHFCLLGTLLHDQFGTCMVARALRCSMLCFSSPWPRQGLCLPWVWGPRRLRSAAMQARNQVAQSLVQLWRRFLSRLVWCSSGGESFRVRSGEAGAVVLPQLTALPPQMVW